MRTTDFCFSLTFLYEYPRLVSSRLLFEACASPMARELALGTRRPVDLAFHDARSASADSIGLSRGFFFRAPLDRIVPLTPLSLPLLADCAFAFSRSNRFA